MEANDLPPDVLRLVSAAIASMDHVEVLRFLHGRRDVPAPVHAIMPEVHMERATLVRVLGDLESAGLVRLADDETGYLLTARDRSAVEELINCYNTRPVTLVRAIYARPAYLRAFSDAFRIRRDD